MGVGDIIAISELALKVRAAYKDAPKGYRDICGEVEYLEIRINRATSYIKGTTLSYGDMQEGRVVLRNCQSVLEDLNSLIEKYTCIDSAESGQIVKKVQFGAEDIATLRARLTVHISSVNGFIQRFDIPTITICQVEYIMLIRLSCERYATRPCEMRGLHRTNSIGSINTQMAFEEFSRSLYRLGVGKEELRQKKGEVMKVFGAQDGILHTTPLHTTPLHSAVRDGDTDMVKRLLENGTSIEDIDKDNNASLHLAARSGGTEVVELLLGKGVLAEALDKDNHNMLRPRSPLNKTRNKQTQNTNTQNINTQKKKITETQTSVGVLVYNDSKHQLWVPRAPLTSAPVGLALGLFPLVMQGIETYISSAAKVEEMIHHRQTLGEFRRELEMEKTIFNNLWYMLGDRAGVPVEPNEELTSATIEDVLSCLHPSSKKCFTDDSQELDSILRELTKKFKKYQENVVGMDYFLVWLYH